MLRIKSLGASRKKPPDVCLDQCIEYGERLRDNESGAKGLCVTSRLVDVDCAIWLWVMGQNPRYLFGDGYLPIVVLLVAFWVFTGIPGF